MLEENGGFNIYLTPNYKGLQNMIKTQTLLHL
jgi:hypothetical protein